MPLSNSVIVMVVSRSYLYTSSSELPINHFVSYDDHFSIRDEGMYKLFAYEFFVAGVFRMHCNCSIT